MPGIGTVPSAVRSHTQQVVRAAFGGALYCAAWLWMARKNKDGRAWARILSRESGPFYHKPLVLV
jgi:hypothetical protein